MEGGGALPCRAESEAVGVAAESSAAVIGDTSIDTVLLSTVTIAAVMVRGKMKEERRADSDDRAVELKSKRRGRRNGSTGPRTARQSTEQQQRRGAVAARTTTQTTTTAPHTTQPMHAQHRRKKVSRRVVVNRPTADVSRLPGEEH